MEIVKKEPMSFSLLPENKEYVKDCCKDKHRSPSHWLDDLITHLRLKAEDKPKVKRSKVKSYPSNFDEQFELLWCIKGKRGAKQKAFDKYRKMAEGQTNDVLEIFTQTLMDDIIKNKGEAGYPELHLTTYLNNDRWER